MYYLLQLLESLGTSPWVLINFYILEVEASAVCWYEQFLEARIGSHSLAFVDTYTSTATASPTTPPPPCLQPFQPEIDSITNVSVDKGKSAVHFQSEVCFAQW